MRANATEVLPTKWGDREISDGWLGKATQEQIKAQEQANAFAANLVKEVADLAMKPITVEQIRTELSALTAQRKALNKHYEMASDMLRDAGFRLSYDEYSEEYVLSVRPVEEEEEEDE